MLRRFAEETTIHGIKEAFFAGRVGRLFWVVIFLGGFTAMVFQLKTIFVSYINGSVGTKTTSTANVGEIESPSFYYCHSHWLPFPEELAACLDTPNFDPLEAGCHDLVNAILTEEIINGLFLEGKHKRMNEEPDFNDETIEERPQAVLKHIRDVYNEIEGKYQGDLAAYILSKTITKRAGPISGPTKPPVFNSEPTGRARPNLTMLAHGVITKYKEVLESDIWSFNPHVTENRPGPIQYLYDTFDTREGTVSVNQNGVCWEIRPEPLVSKPWNLSTIVQDHYVVHLGAYIYTLNPLVMRHGYGDVKRYRPFLKKFPGGEYSPPIGFSTNLFIAAQAQKFPSFGEGLKLTGDVEAVMVKFWTKKTIHLNRKSYLCREDWSPLDAAHCNQEQKMKTDPWKYGCKVYLPSSRHYAATPLNETCKAANMRNIIATGTLGYTKSSLQWQLQDAYKAQERFPLDDPEDQQFMEQLLKTVPTSPPSGLEANAFIQDQHPDCPHTCSEVKYKFEVTYTRKIKTDHQSSWQIAHAENACSIAVDYILRSSNATTDWERIVKFFLNHEHLEQFSWKEETGIELPCTRVSLQQNEINGDGTIIEEYPLYSFTDLLSNIGGTLGLWIGASVISFIQCIYLFCLERLFTKREDVEVAPVVCQCRCQSAERGTTEKPKDTKALKKEVQVVPQGSHHGHEDIEHGAKRRKKDATVYPEDEVLQMLDKSESYARRFGRY